jgi:hypothetical protein
MSNIQKARAFIQKVNVVNAFSEMEKLEMSDNNRKQFNIISSDYASGQKLDTPMVLMKLLSCIEEKTEYIVPNFDSLYEIIMKQEERILRLEEALNEIMDKIYPDNEQI